MFNKCVEVADIIKFSEQRIKDIEPFKDNRGKLLYRHKGQRD